jgi:prolyl 4-hydroxylase
VDQLPGAIEKQALASVHIQNFSTTTISIDPLLIYISDFLLESEINRILDVTQGLFVPSRVYNPGSSSHRNSSSYVLPSTDSTQDVIKARSKSFLEKVLREHPATGLSYFDIEPLQLVRYGPSDYFHAHVDWFDALHREKKGWNSRLYSRGANFFIYLEDECIGGVTNFPYIAASSDES